MSVFLPLAGLILFIAVLPALREMRRKPINEDFRATAPGEFAALTAGSTHYQWHGPRSKKVLVLVHGLSTPSWVFSGLIREFLMLQYRVLSYDLYGRGFSDSVRGAQTLELHVNQLHELLDTLGVQMPVTVMGYSMGGSIAAAFAAEQADRVERVILLAPAGIEYTPGRFNRIARDFGVFGAWLWGMFAPWKLRREARDDAAKPTSIPDLRARISRELRRKGYLKSMLSCERHTLSMSLQEAHEEIGAMYIPTLAIWGEEDSVIPVSSVGKLALWNRQARQAVIPQAAHSLGHSKPDEVMQEIRDFLREVPD